MSDNVTHLGNFREFQGYWFDLHEKIEEYRRDIDDGLLESDTFEPYEVIAHSIAHLGDPGWAIYEAIYEHGEAEVVHSLVESAIRKSESEKAGIYWEKFLEADEAFRNPDEQIFSKLENAGMPEEEIRHVREMYEEAIEPLLDGSKFEEQA